MHSDHLEIVSKHSTYQVDWCKEGDSAYREAFASSRSALVDKKVWDLFRNTPNFQLLQDPVLLEAREDYKTIETCAWLCEQLLNHGHTRNETLLVIGGGIIQDIANFAASILHRGVPWIYVPTTVLAQVDSCIGGKSSINLGPYKNQVGQFYPPKQVYIVRQFVDTLPDRDLRSGLGEVVKIHLIMGEEKVHWFARNYDKIYAKGPELDCANRTALHCKADLIQQDEFDRSMRMKLNFGHTFGHALEAASQFEIPHGIAVTYGIDMANYFAWKTGRITEKDFQLLHAILMSNVRSSDWTKIAPESFFTAFRRDKKNSPGHYGLILPVALGQVEICPTPITPEVDRIIGGYFDEIAAGF